MAEITQEFLSFASILGGALPFKAGSESMLRGASVAAESAIEAYGYKQELDENGHVSINDKRELQLGYIANPAINAVTGLRRQTYCVAMSALVPQFTFNTVVSIVASTDLFSKSNVEANRNLFFGKGYPLAVNHFRLLHDEMNKVMNKNEWSYVPEPGIAEINEAWEHFTSSQKKAAYVIMSAVFEHMWLHELAHVFEGHVDYLAGVLGPDSLLDTSDALAKQLRYGPRVLLEYFADVEASRMTHFRDVAELNFALLNGRSSEWSPYLMTLRAIGVILTTYILAMGRLAQGIGSYGDHPDDKLRSFSAYEGFDRAISGEDNVNLVRGSAIRPSESPEYESFICALTGAKQALQKIDWTLERWMTKVSRAVNIDAVIASSMMRINRSQLMDQVRLAKVSAFGKSRKNTL
jgi:hypothetical protein